MGPIEEYFKYTYKPVITQSTGSFEGDEYVSENFFPPLSDETNCRQSCFFCSQSERLSLGRAANSTPVTPHVKHSKMMSSKQRSVLCRGEFTKVINSSVSLRCVCST